MRQSAGFWSTIVIVLVALSPAVGGTAVLEIEDTTGTPATGLEDPQPVPTDERSCSSPFEYLPEWVEPMPYSISGGSKEELKNAIGAAVSGDSAVAEGQHFGALTVSTYSYRIVGEPVLTPETSGDSCRCTAKGFADISLSVSITYPVWTDMASCQDTAFIKDWTGYIAAVYSHELGHAYAARAGLSTLKKELDSIRTSETGILCNEVCDMAGQSYRREVEDAFRMITAEIEKTHREYDSETGYGKDQGATF